MMCDRKLFEQATYEFAASQEDQIEAAGHILLSAFEILNGAVEDSETYNMLIGYFFDIAANIPNKKIH
jgi:hypothetical protein